MYWAVREDGNFEIIDGQQRTISLCQYAKGDFYRHGLYFDNLPDDKQDAFLNYRLMIYLCSGTASEKLDWFKVVNIAGAELSDQELRNAVYPGPWLADAKRYFSRKNCSANNLGGQYMNGEYERQEFLETIIKWRSGGKIEEYMAQHQHDENANDLWPYFQTIISWIEATFQTYRKEMKGIGWGPLYDQFKDEKLDTGQIEDRIKKLLEDEDVSNKKGIYAYILTGKEKHLNIRAFSDSQKREAYERQDGKCAICQETFDIAEMEADHITPWHAGGKTLPENCQILCREDNRRKSGK